MDSAHQPVLIGLRIKYRLLRSLIGNGCLEVRHCTGVDTLVLVENPEISPCFSLLPLWSYALFVFFVKGETLVLWDLFEDNTFERLLFCIEAVLLHVLI
jgi:hypothetical protein